MQAAGPPGRVGAVQDLNHLSALESQLVILEGLKVVQRPGPPHSLSGVENRGVRLSQAGRAGIGTAGTGEGCAGPGSESQPSLSRLPRRLTATLQRHFKPCCDCAQTGRQSPENSHAGRQGPKRILESYPPCINRRLFVFFR